MSLTSVKSLFFKDYAVKTLELKGDYEIWAHDIEEYFSVSGLPNYFQAIVDYTEPDLNMDIREDEAEVDKTARHTLLMKQARYAIYRSLGDSIKREMAKEKLAITNVMDLWRAVRSCFYSGRNITVGPGKGWKLGKFLRAA